MSEVAKERSELEQSLVAKLSHLPLSQETAWLSKLRAEAAKHVIEHGLPASKNEAWRFVPMNDLLASSFDSLSDAPVQPSAHRNSSQAPVLCQNGSYSLKKQKHLSGLSITTLHAANTKDKEAMAFFLARIAKQRDAWFELNTALFSDLLWINVEKGAQIKTPIDVEYIISRSSGNALVHPRVLITLGESSECTVVEHFLPAQDSAGLHLSNSVVETVIGANANLHHFRIFSGSEQDYHLYQYHARIESDGHLDSHSYSMQGAFRREDLSITLNAQGSECSLEGCYITDNDEFSGHYTTVEHTCPRALSAQRYRGVLAAQSQAVFDGGIKVARDAQKSSATQENHNLLLSDSAVIHTKPQLQIDADDVKCSHGATVGQLDPVQMFYLRTRGIDEQHAKALLTYGFVRELLQAAQNLPVFKALQTTLLSRLGAEQVLEELC
ncbi:MAG: Fe-S cluster assembly protein SufD [Myxococcales bacterium]|nr:MAG: Fe-S cluster assembly protein SufD [Myxococcales bacterium]